MVYGHNHFSNSCDKTISLLLLNESFKVIVDGKCHLISWFNTKYVFVIDKFPPYMKTISKIVILVFQNKIHVSLRSAVMQF